MKKIDDDKIKFKRKIFNQKGPYYITYEKYWDGGFEKYTSLSDKADFYFIANMFSNVIKRVVCDLKDSVIIGRKFSEKERLFENWNDKESYDCFNNLKEYVKKGKCYELKVPKDNLIIDYIVENNFRYLTCIDLFLPKSNIVLQPTCHSEVFVYADNYEKVLPVLKKAVEQSQLSLSKYNCD